MSIAREGRGSTARGGLVAISVLLAVGLAARLLLVLVVYPGQGFSSDMDLFVDWGRGLLQRGPAGFYSGDGTANYPPLAIWMLGGLTLLSDAVGANLVVLLKVPGVLADVGVAALIYGMVLRRSGRTAALIAAAVALVVPVLWYDSALWGQFDSILTLLSLAALALLIDDRPVLAMVLAMAAWLFKPQGVLVLLVVTTVIVVAVVRRSLDGGRPGRLPRTSRAPTLVLAIGAVIASLLVVVVPFDYERLATGNLAGVAVFGDVAGLLQQNLSTAALFPVLTANAYNVWALVGDPTLAATIGGASAAWHVDTVLVLGVPAGTIGLVLAGVVLLAVVVGLCVRHDGTAILLAFTVLAVAFFGFPTRVHERYLVGAFATMIVLAAGSAVKIGATVLLSIVNTVNLHAVLAGGPGVTVLQARRSDADGPVALLAAAVSRGGMDVAARRPPLTVSPALPVSDVATAAPRAAYISLPWGEAARQEWVAVACSVTQTAAALVLLVGWVVFVARTRGSGPRRHSSA